MTINGPIDFARPFVGTFIEKGGGASGATGPQGPTGPAGPAGPAGAGKTYPGTTLMATTDPALVEESTGVYRLDDWDIALDRTHAALVLIGGWAATDVLKITGIQPPTDVGTGEVGCFSLFVAGSVVPKITIEDDDANSASANRFALFEARSQVKVPGGVAAAMWLDFVYLKGVGEWHFLGARLNYTHRGFSNVRALTLVNPSALEPTEALASDHEGLVTNDGAGGDVQLVLPELIPAYDGFTVTVSRTDSSGLYSVVPYNGSPDVISLAEGEVLDGSSFAQLDLEAGETITLRGDCETRTWYVLGRDKPAASGSSGGGGEFSDGTPVTSEVLAVDANSITLTGIDGTAKVWKARFTKLVNDGPNGRYLTCRLGSASGLITGNVYQYHSAKPTSGGTSYSADGWNVGNWFRPAGTGSPISNSPGDESTGLFEIWIYHPADAARTAVFWRGTFYEDNTANTVMVIGGGVVETTDVIDRVAILLSGSPDAFDAGATAELFKVAE